MADTNIEIHPGAARLASGLAEFTEGSQAVGFVESLQQLQLRAVDGRIVSQVSGNEGGLSRTVLTEGRWRIGAVPWALAAERSRVGLSVAEVAEVRRGLLDRDDSIGRRLESLGSAWALREATALTIETLADVVTRRRAVAQRGAEPVLETSRWTRLRMRVVDVERGVELARRQWVGLGADLVEDEVAAFAAAVVPNSSSMSRPARAGRHTSAVVLEGSASACLLHELLGHIAEQDSLSRPTAYAREIRSFAGAHPELSVADEPGLSGGIGNQQVDDEGSPTSRTALVRAGAFGEGLGTLAHPGPGGAVGCARRMTYAVAPLPRATNTVVEAGTADRDELLAGDRVLVVTGFASGYVVPATGDFQYVATRCRLIDAAGVTEVGDVLVNGNAVEVLRSISAVGSDTGSTVVTCGKRQQWVTVGMQSPSVRVERLEWSCG